MRSIVLMIGGLFTLLFGAAVNVITVVATVYGVLVCLKMFGLLS